jgi:hypothetical protein
MTVRPSDGRINELIAYGILANHSWPVRFTCAVRENLIDLARQRSRSMRMPRYECQDCYRINETHLQTNYSQWT